MQRVENMDDDKQGLFHKMEEHLLKDDKPSEYFNSLVGTALFQKEYPFNLLSRLCEIEQSPKHHPEGNVWNHTMLVLDNAAQVKSQSSDTRVFMWSALLHDIGKATTTKLRKGRITSYDHDKEGEKLARSFLECFTQDEEFISKVTRMVRWHMQILFITNKLPFSDIRTMKSQVEVKEIGLLGFCDRLGRKMEQDVNKEIETMENFIRICNEIT
jgi:putative nucleotidyltransferase with HDIG domain